MVTELLNHFLYSLVDAIQHQNMSLLPLDRKQQQQQQQLDSKQSPQYEHKDQTNDSII